MLMEFKDMKVILLYPFKSELMTQTLTNLFPPKPNQTYSFLRFLKTHEKIYQTEAVEIKTKNKLKALSKSDKLPDLSHVKSKLLLIK